MIKLLVTTKPFGHKNNAEDMLLSISPRSFNDKKCEPNKVETISFIKRYQPETIIAGTEPYDKEVLSHCKNLKLISRVGIGVNSVDLDECEKRNIAVTNTPDAPSNAVAEMTICQMLNLLRKIPRANTDLKNGIWNRYVGKELQNCNVGIIGQGRIGGIVTKNLMSLGRNRNKKLYVNDIDKDVFQGKYRFVCSYVSIEELLEKSDIITLHIPLNEKNKNFINKREFDIMGNNKILINTSRGGIVNEDALYDWLQDANNSAAVDTFVDEPYKGKLISCENVILSPHLGSCTIQSRKDMEEGAAREVINYFNNKPFNNRVV